MVKDINEIIRDENCKVTEDGTVFTNIKDIDGNTIKTAEEWYNEWLENKNKEIIKEPTTEEYLVDLDYRLSKIEMGV